MADYDSDETYCSAGEFTKIRGKRGIGSIVSAVSDVADVAPTRKSSRIASQQSIPYSQESLSDKFKCKAKIPQKRRFKRRIKNTTEEDLTAEKVHLLILKVKTITEMLQADLSAQLYQLKLSIDNQLKLTSLSEIFEKFSHNLALPPKKKMTKTRDATSQTDWRHARQSRPRNKDKKPKKNIIPKSPISSDCNSNMQSNEAEIINYNYAEYYNANNIFKATSPVCFDYSSQSSSGGYIPPSDPINVNPQTAADHQIKYCSQEKILSSQPEIDLTGSADPKLINPVKWMLEFDKW